jgi:hypothetical protein
VSLTASLACAVESSITTDDWSGALIVRRETAKSEAMMRRKV